jgi:membrane-associated phospholipid phosphatase
MTAHPRGAEIASLYGRRIRVLGASLEAVDALVLGALFVQAALLLGFGRWVDRPFEAAAKNCGLAALYFGAAWLAPRVRPGIAYFFLRMGSVLLMFGFLYEAHHPLQLILHGGWWDRAVLGAEQAVLGGQPTLWLEPFVSPALTEWMMFAYVIYLVIYPSVAGLIYFKRGPRALEDYLFTLGFANLACDLGFILFPVAGPLFFMPEAYTVPLQGGLFTALGEYIRTHAHLAGGSIPSPHCAIATVMWLMSWRYVRPAFYALAPVILSLYAATVYCRYHYVSDSIAGIALGLLVILTAPALARRWGHFAAGRGTGPR